MVLYYTPIPLLGNSPFSLSYVGNGGVQANASGSISQSVSIGTALSNRWVVIGFALNTSGSATTPTTITSPVLGGIAMATVIVQNCGGGGAGAIAGIFIAKVPTGTTATFTCTVAGTGSQAGTFIIHVWNILNLLSAGDAINGGGGAGATTVPMTVPIHANGGAVYVACSQPITGTGSAKLTWTIGAGVTQDTDATNGSQFCYGAAHATTVSGATPTVSTIRSGAIGGSTETAGCGASFH